MVDPSSNQRPFWTASTEEILSGRVTDVYFERVARVLAHRDKNPTVRAEVRATALPREWPWGVLAGVEEVAKLFAGLPVRIESAPEGSVFAPGDPVVTVIGKYLDFGVYETALLGLLCQASGIATQSARCRKLAGGQPIYSFGARRMHPTLGPMIDRAAYIGGCDAVALGKSAEMIGEKPVGTMSHSLMICMESEYDAFRAFDEVTEGDIPRIALVDTFSDEKFGALQALEALGDRLWGVRLDTPSSRRGDFRSIIEEVRWELSLRGAASAKILVSGGIDEVAITELNDVVDAYGIGTYISNAPVIDFAMDIVEVDGRPLAKRGKPSGGKSLWRCEVDGGTVVTPKGASAPIHCGRPMGLLSQALVDHGRISELPRAQEIRARTLDQLSRVTLKGASA